MVLRLIIPALALVLLSLGGQAQSEATITTVAEGLYYPAGMALMADGSVLIAEAGGHGERSAGVSLLQPDGSLGRLISGIPSTFSRNNLISAPVVAVTPTVTRSLSAWRGAQLYNLPSAAARRLPDAPIAPNELERGKRIAAMSFFCIPLICL